MRHYTQNFLNSINTNFICEYIDTYPHVVLLSGRMTGKTILSEYYLLTYLTKYKNKNVFFTSRTQLHKDRANEILYHINKSNDFKTEYSINDFTKQNSKTKAYYGEFNNLLFACQEIELDLIVIDEINGYKIKDKQLEIIRHSIKRNNTKLLINGQYDDKIIEYLIKMGIYDKVKLINDDFIKNINYYSRSLKIKKILNEKRDSFYIQG